MKWNPRESNRLLIVACSAMSAAAGAVVGYAVASKILEEKFQEQLKVEIEDARSYFQNMYSTPTFVVEEPSAEEATLLEAVKEATDEHDGMPEDAVGNALAAQRTYSGNEEETQQDPGDPRPPVNVVINNIFEEATPTGDEVLEALQASRDPSSPYIITKEEFYLNEPDFEQKKFTYWDGDDILVDDQEELNPVDNERVAGEDNLARFGTGSGDEHVLYVRNETLDPPIDLHITRSMGRYSVEVMALDEGEPHLQHSQPRKFRTRDE